MTPPPMIRTVEINTHLWLIYTTVVNGPIEVNMIAGELRQDFGRWRFHSAIPPERRAELLRKENPQLSAEYLQKLAHDKEITFSKDGLPSAAGWPDFEAALVGILELHGFELERVDERRVIPVGGDNTGSGG